MESITTIDELIRAFEGQDGLAAAAGVVRTAVTNWKKADKIPPRHYPVLSAKAELRGCVLSPWMFLGATRAGPSKPHENTVKESGNGRATRV